MHNPNDLAMFGDLCIKNDSNKENSCSSNLGKTFKPPDGKKPESAEAHKYFNGSES